MSDRAPVNRATVDRFEQAWHKPITSVYCHLHPLDTISRSILGCLTKFENDVVFDKLFSGRSLADKVILAIDKFRFLDSSGDPKRFIAFLVRKNLPRGLIVRIRGNRLHVMLKNAETIVQHTDLLVEYCKTSCLRETASKATILEALQNPVVADELKAVAIVSVILSSSWMKSLYVAHGSGLTHISAFKKVKSMYDKIVNLVSQQNLDLGNLTTDLFGNEITCNLLGKPIEEGDIWLTGSRTLSVTHMMQHMLRQTESDLRHQYDNYLRSKSNK